jgi:diaminopimelate epimerase
MQAVPFTKMSGVGNDFIIVDNRGGILPEIGMEEFARRVCTRRMSLGGDQLMVIEPPTAGGDFCMRTINPDGTEVKMCGNASRCVARYAYMRGIAGARMTIDTLGGPVYAWVEGDEVRVQLQLTSQIELHHALIVEGERYLAHTVHVSGAPHAVLYMSEVARASSDFIQRLGTAIRHHADFPHGINVNFLQVMDRHTLCQRTFERGVEGETLACGTGAIASSVISALLGQVDSPVRLHVLGGELSVSFERQGQGFGALFLGGGARFVAEGALHPESWSWLPPELEAGVTQSSAVGLQGPGRMSVFMVSGQIPCRA